MTLQSRPPLPAAVAAVATALICNLSATTLHVSPDSPNPARPYATWATAARVIQDAKDAAALRTVFHRLGVKE
jgi:hypothetical protein